MKKFFKGIAIIFALAICTFLVGATTYALNADFKSWVDTDILQTVEKDEVLDGENGAGINPDGGNSEDEVTPEDGDDEPVVLSINWR